MMKLIPTLFSLFLTVTTTTSAFAQDANTVLVPIALEEPVSGAFNSLFKTEIWVANTGAAPLRLAVQCQIECEDAPLNPGQTYRNSMLHYERVAGRPFAHVYVTSGSADDLTVTARIQDVARQALTWGTEIPVVRAPDLRRSLQLIDIPTDSRFRQTMRVYSFRATEARLRVLSLVDDAPGVTLVDEIVKLESPSGLPAGLGSHAGYFQVLNIVDTYPQTRAAQRLRIEVDALDSQKIWAFVSVTNNETQHITTITPQK